MYLSPSEHRMSSVDEAMNDDFSFWRRNSDRLSALGAGYCVKPLMLVPRPPSITDGQRFFRLSPRMVAFGLRWPQKSAPETALGFGEVGTPLPSFDAMLSM